MLHQCAQIIFVAAQVAPITASAQGAAFEFRIPAGSLDSALRTYARLTGRKVLYRSESVRNRRSGGLTGRFGADEALSRLLDGSGLTAVTPSAGVVVLELPPRMAAETTAHDDPIVVVGTNIRGATPTADTRTITRRDIEAAGRATIADVLAALPSNFGGSGNPVAALTGADPSAINNALAPGANLRGLGPDATLTLFDGRRIAGSGGRGDFADLSAIPSLAVDRVEILADGASAIYGSDAVGGVVNLVLRHRLKGVEVRLRGGTATRDGGKSTVVAMATGSDWKTGGAFVTYEFEHRDSLSAADRNYTATGDLRPFGGSDRRLYYSSPGTILAFDPLTGGFTPAYKIPKVGPGETPTLAQITPGQNNYNSLSGFDLAPRIDRHAMFGHIEQNLTPELEAFLDIRYVRRRFTYRSPASITPFAVTAVNPYFLPVDGQPFSLIAYSFYPELGPGRTRGRVSSLGLTAGADWSLGRWSITGYGSAARERSSDRSDNIVNATALDEALGNLPDDPATPFSTSSAGFFNPYGSGSSNGPGILQFVGSGFAKLRRRSEIVDTLLKADGPIADMDGGVVRIAAGIAYRSERFASGGQTFYYGSTPADVNAPAGHRGIGSVFGELNLPIFGPGNGAPGIRSLVLSAAVRHERYSDFGTTTNPKLGVAWSPAGGVSVRASLGTSFRAPALIEINDRRTISPTQLLDGTGGYVPAIFVGGGNPSLGPERARTWSGGFTLEPSPAPGLRLTFNLFSTRFSDRISQPALQDSSRALTDPSLATYVERIDPASDPAALARVEALLAEPNAASAGGLPATAFGAIVDARYVNSGRVSVSGLDAEARLTRNLGAGRFDIGVNATWLFKYDVQTTPLSTPRHRLDTLGNPVAFRARGDLGFSRGALSINLFGNWTGSYRDDAGRPLRPIDDFLTFDGVLAVAPSGGPLKGLRIALSAENLLDAAPPFVDRTTGIGFDAANANPFGRVLALEVRRVF